MVIPNLTYHRVTIVVKRAAEGSALYSTSAYVFGLTGKKGKFLGARD
jgi:hypothetical protein